MPDRERCARDSDWCDGTTCREFWEIDCPNADPLGMKSTCGKRPACGCSVECREHRATVIGEPTDLMVELKRSFDAVPRTGGCEPEANT